MKWFDEYKEKILSGEIIVDLDILKVLNRIERYKNTYEFVQNEADRRIRFIENECSTTKGKIQPVKLALWQKVIIEVAFGFYISYKDNKRLIHEIPVEIGRGNGKTSFGAWLVTIIQMIDKEIGADIACLAYDRNQSKLLYNAFDDQGLRTDSLIHKFKKAKQWKHTIDGIKFFPTNSLAQILTSDYNSLDGTNLQGVFLDEVHTYEKDFIKVILDGCRRKRKNWQCWYLTTNGVVRGKVFDKKMKEWQMILDEKIEDDSVCPFLFHLDEKREIYDTKMWIKANPMLGILFDEKDILKDIEKAQKANDPVAQTEIMTKTFNLPMNSYMSYFSNEECEECSSSFDLKYFKGTKEKKKYCLIGADLSDVNDICTISVCVPYEKLADDKENFITDYYFKNFNFVPKKTLETLPQEIREIYKKWESNGNLILHDFEFNDRKFIFETVNNFIKKNNLYVIGFFYDPWHAKEIVQMVEDYGMPTFKLSQTVKNLSDPLKLYKVAIGNKHIVTDDEVSHWCHANVNIKIDGNGNIFPNKAKAKNKIDTFAAQLDCFAGYEIYKDDLKYYKNYYSDIDKDKI
jgi:phage terminase large subunit-like protein